MIAEQFVLARRPVSLPRSDDFARNVAPLPPLREGEVSVRNTAMQLTAVMVELMRGADLPMPPYPLAEPLWGPAVGVVLESRSAEFAAGDPVQSMRGWRSAFVAPAEELTPVPSELRGRPEVLLCQGPTAYHGIADIAQVHAGDTVFVSGAAGGVGSLAGQIARRLGAARVVGSAGTDDKCRWLVEELGFDTACNYRDPDFIDRLRDAAPTGYSVCFDTVGGRQFEHAIEAAGPGARIALCGTLAQQFAGPGIPAGPRLDLATAIRKQLRILPFSTFHTPEQIAQWLKHYTDGLATGEIVFPHSLVPGGLKAAPAALAQLGAGGFRGNVVVRLNHDAA
ncbi:MDR family NADP-dependent oxidoreductase [Leucobacter chromiireducens]|uniref:NADP-dependent oxidoreductase n=1 Tax=Leucobacter chromiireducens subsp. solipictus TaxID=398235 RepID=A0ABS1SHT7_9MICO|nr:NADP-dependent oxidoreductase [Leucobacter chromiireducens]MBL3680119.1 NADP-dependent oxidoreductase [Leucobacter chromiireducens subsp. solipictus]